jgi:hypothetical protein
MARFPKVKPLDYPHVRRSTTCPLCLGRKSVGLMACWPCFNSYGLKRANPQKELTIAERERQLAYNASRDPGFVDLDRMYEDTCADICGR